MLSAKTTLAFSVCIALLASTQASSLLSGFFPSIPTIRAFDSWLDPYDDILHLSNSMRHLTKFADRITQTLAEPSSESSDRKNVDASSSKHGRLALHGDNFELQLRPRIDWQETRDGFMLTAATPGLSKEDLAIDVVEADGAHHLEISGQTSSSSGGPASNSTEVSSAEASKPLALRTSYRSFSHRVRLPAGVDRESLKAKYENGLLVVTMHKTSKEAPQRQRIAIA